MALSTKPLGAGVVWLNLSGDHCSRAAKGSCTCGFLLCSAWQEGPSEADWVGEDLPYKGNAECQVLQVSGAVIFRICPAFCVLLQLHHFSSQATVSPDFSSAFVELCASADKPFSVLLSQLSWFHFYQHKINEFFFFLFFQPLRPRRVISHCCIISIILSSRSLDSTLETGAVHSAGVPLLLSTALPYSLSGGSLGCSKAVRAQDAFLKLQEGKCKVFSANKQCCAGLCSFLLILSGTNVKYNK